MWKHLPCRKREKTKQTLKSHLELAKALGAKTVTVYGEDAAYQIAEYAIVSNVSKVVMGRTNHRESGAGLGSK